MTAAVAGRAAAAAGGGGRAAAGGAAARRPRARNIDERSQRAGERFDARYSKPGAADKKPRRRAEQPADVGGTDTDSGTDSERSTGRPSSEPTRSTTVNMPGPVSSGAGFILAVLFWSWVALPFLKAGPKGVRNTLKAKFTNKAPDGSWLP
jgi:hypothetical protein